MDGFKKLHFACVGDIHGFWTRQDTEYFNQSNYDFILFTGDLANHNLMDPKNKDVMDSISQLQKTAYLIPGNWDSSNYMQIMGEIWQNHWMISMGSKNHLERYKYFQERLSPVIVEGYKIYSFNLNLGCQVSLLLGRPFTCGGQNLAFCPTLKKLYGIETMQDSMDYYKKIIQEHYDTIQKSNHSHNAAPILVFLTHNGPTGLGTKATDIYGCDFRPEEGDWGDPDLEVAIQYAKELGFSVPLVVSGHMHHCNPKTKSIRKWLVERDRTTYLNAAKVPRNGSYFHVELDVGTQSTVVEEKNVTK